MLTGPLTIWENIQRNETHLNALFWWDIRCTMHLQLIWACVEFKAIPGHGFFFGSQRAYLGGESMHGISFLWYFPLLLNFISYTFSVIWQEKWWGTDIHDNGNPASCSLWLFCTGANGNAAPLIRACFKAIAIKIYLKSWIIYTKRQTSLYV